MRFARGIFAATLGIVVLGGAVAAGGGYMVYRHYAADLPDVDGLRNYKPPVMSRVFAGNARLLAELATERRIFVPFGAIPPIVRQAFISAEDHNFYSHGGVDPVAIVRAAVFDLLHAGQRRPLGASTITQQVAKNMLLDNQMSLSRKIKEAILAIRIEDTLTKDRILELYLNEIYLGLGSYGVAAAAQAYFNKPLDQLTIPEAAFLAGLPKAPNNFNPFKYPEAARIRRDYVLDRLAEDHVITAAQAAQFKTEPIVPAEFHRPPPIPGADWFTEEVRRQLIARFGQEATTEGGLMVRTSLDPALQAAAEKALRNGLMTYDRRRGGWRGPVGHLTVAPADFSSRWPTALAATAHPPGMLPNWRLAIVASAGDADAQVDWLGDNGEHRTATLALSDTTWARPVTDGKPGATPRRMADVVQPGDIVMIEPVQPQSAQPQSASAQSASTQAASAQAASADSPKVQPADASPPGKAKAAAPAGRAYLRQIPLVQGALVSLDPRTGRVLAMVGGWSFEESQFNRAVQASRQPGSSFKPMVYLTALEKGISPSQRFLDAPVVIDTPDGKWRPGNYEGTFGGPTPLRVALEQSLNLVTLRVAERVGMSAIANTAITFHMVDQMPKVLPAALGAVQTTVIREAGAYASIAAGGREVVPTLIDSVQDQDGHVVMRAQGQDCKCSDPSQPPLLTDDRPQIADPASDYQLIKMMEGVVQRGTGIPAVKGLNRPIAGKTGTTQDFNDAWFSGFTPDLVTVVWVGFDTPASLGENETGGNVAGPIWHDYMATALTGHPILHFPMPPGVTLAQWQSGTGMVTDAFKPDQVPGASGPLGGGGSVVSASSGDNGQGSSGSSGGSGGIDNGLGGLY
ncbi:MAG TPA: PBP1A family penicillin-binding protein [Rhodopila sp.]|uniref:penicillin-binding protein 1A n=1 Tax=Rhodopila sp. TaxID=2480087 RepID=UPI002D1BB6C3|nr:PBP1A family penicillin-binding protein [Rhodopila sp.]HVY17403.1 PBP1A family penicillin-binding protein [Rhodopila sp.]